MKRILFSVFGLMTLLLCFPSNAAAEGRWKVSGSECVWDQNDSGPNQCGRFKVGGEYGCYWEVNDSGGDQCTPDVDLPTAISMADDLSSISGQDYSDLQAAIDVAASYGVVDGDDYSALFFADQYSYGGLTCGQKASLTAKAEKLVGDLNIATVLLGGAAMAATGLFPPAAPGLGAGALLTTGLAAAASSLSGRIQAASCT